MPTFRFPIPFFSYGSPSRLSSGTSSPSPPPTPPPSRPSSTPSETKSKVSSSLSRVRSNVAAMAASLSGSQPPSRGPATPTRLAKQSNKHSGSPESLRMEEGKVKMKEKSSKETGETSIVRPEPNEAQEQRKRTELEKLAVQEKEKVLPKEMEEKSEAAQEQQNKSQAEIAVQEKKKFLGKDMGDKLEAAQEQQKKKEVEKLAVQESKTKKFLPKDLGETSEVAQEEQKKREDEKRAIQEITELGQRQEKIKDKDKVALQETKRALQATNGEDATQSKTTQETSAASESTRGLNDQPETKAKPQDRTVTHTDDSQRKTKRVTMGTQGNPKSGEDSSSISRKMKQDIRDGISKLTWGKSNGDEKSVSVITLTGENRGATMAIDSEKDKKSSEVPIRRGYKSNLNESPNTTSTETEEEKRNPKNHKEEKEEEEDKKVRAYVNVNTQGINNSIVLESSVSENDPGIHMSLKYEETYKEIINPPENVVEKKPEMLKNEPRVRRRCLRGLLAESSESETKPRRHGCRFTCKDKNIENT